MIRRLSGVLLLTLLSVLLTACGDDGGGVAPQASADDQPESLTVVATTSIIASLVDEVADGHAEVDALMGSGVDPHSYEPSPGDIQAVAEADLILANGLGLDDHLLDDIDAASSGHPVVTVTDGIEPIPFLGGEEHDHEEGHDHGDLDPHVWLDPIRAQQMVDAIADALAEVDPEHADDYRSNAERYNAVLAETDAEIESILSPIPAEERTVLVSHDAFGYFAARYGFTIAGSVMAGGSSETDTSAGHLAELIELIDEQHVSAILTTRESNATIARQIADDAGIILIDGLYGDQLGEPGSGAETLDGMLLSNARTIAGALGAHQ